MSQLSTDVDKFWDLIDVKLGCNVPKYIQNILLLNGFDKALSVKTITIDDIEYFQEYARNDMHKRIPKNADLSEYYGLFCETPKEFVFLRGHLRLLQ